MYVMIDGTSISASTANICIGTPYFREEVEAWCMKNTVYELIVGNIEGARLPEEPNPYGTLTQAVETRAQKKEESTPYQKMKVPEKLQIEATPDEIKEAQQQDISLKKMKEMVHIGDEQVQNGGRSSSVTKK